MADDILKNIPLPADLPENWTSGQIVAPTGAEAGLDEQHGYNYLMRQVNNAQKAAKAIAAALLNYAYPVGSLYMSAESTSPASIVGGTWEQIKDRFILAAGDTYAAGSTGGEATHTLTENELPYIDGTWQTFVVNRHAFDGVNGHAYGTTALKEIIVNGVSSYESNTYSAVTGYLYGFKFGQNVPHNNMPPYLTAYIWKRIA